MSKQIDRNGHRWGAALSSLVLLYGFAADLRVVVPAMTGVLLVGPLFGLRYSPLGIAYRSVRRALKLRIPVELEEEAPARFAQLLGAVFLGAGTAVLYAANSKAGGWTLALLVAGLQALLAVTGICVGCEMYLLGKRLGAKRA